MAKNEPWVWSVVRPDGGRTEHYRPEHAERIAAEIPGSRVVELAPVDPLARAVVETAVALYAPRDWQDWRGAKDAAESLARAVKALVAARKEGT